MITSCKICGAETLNIGSKKGELDGHIFYISRCPVCHFTFVANPDTDYEKLYSEAYYTGHGADKWIDYVFELEHFKTTTRRYEWEGLVRIVEILTSKNYSAKWLDFGCGNGGLVKYATEHGFKNIVGFEEGWITSKHDAYAIPTITRDSFNEYRNSFDIVTAIEVLEHTEYPLEVLAQIRALLKPSGLFFLTTANAEPYRTNILKWAYLVPDIHISLFEPSTLERALRATGFRPEFRPFMPGLESVIKYKLLKRMQRKRVFFLDRLIPWSIIARLTDSALKISSQPIGWAE